MKIYLACTVRGDRGAISALREVADVIEQMGHTVLTRHLLDDGVDDAESLLTERDVFLRDMDWLVSADLVIADASGSSYGVGFEVGYVLGRSAATQQRVLLLFDEARRASISRLIIGTEHPSCTTYSYRSAHDLMPFVSRFLSEAPESHDVSSA